MHGPEGRPSALLAAIILKEHYQTSAVLNEQANDARMVLRAMRS